MYDKFRSVAAVKKAYRRCRKVQHFIFTGKRNLSCAKCGVSIQDHGDAPQGYRSNLCEYHPKRKAVIAYHYTCAWEAILDTVIKSSRVY